MRKVIKRIPILLLSGVLIINILAPAISAVAASDVSGELVSCSLFCNIMPDKTQDAKGITCQHHAREAKKKKLAEHFQCTIVPASCHDSASTQTVSEIDPYLLTRCDLESNLIIASSYENKLIIPSQSYNILIDKPPTTLS